MSPDRMDAISELLKDSPADIRAIHKEVLMLRDIMVENDAKLRDQVAKNKIEVMKEIREGFAGVATRCSETYASCDAKRMACAATAEELKIGQAVNKTKLSMLFGGSALAGGLGAKILEWFSN